MITLADIKAAWRSIALVVVITIIAALCILLANSRTDIATLKSDNDVLRNDNSLQGSVIAAQAFNFSRFNLVAEQASKLNSLIDAGTEETVIEYREILRREKTCDLPVPADIAGGLFEYTHRLRTSAMHADPASADTAGDSATAPSELTYCQAVLWIRPLLAAIEKGNNNLAGIRQIEQERK
ncbi:hypothetical protein [Enterobacter kobei]|uniref:hypothetical protein n=1 Tax=Enterobacter kobei TaxID=208224 RepID=UPI0005ECA660|nr:hypothetical protein [Enterobacter kobei]KJM83768.1 hypothetical protein SS33_25405 [Enterobacter kobei]MCU2430800.1 hypothetical protein [Enterobacter kobei]HCB1630595.1 hypothetical protein [Enterobacter kobei]HCC8327943.1 hypothetical protein [Enterobacter kobei]